MKKRTAFIGAILSLIPLGQPFLIKTVLVASSAFMLSFSEKLNADSVDFYFDRALEKGKNGDYYGAISDFTKVIEINPDYAAYYNRGNMKSDLQDYYGAISDYTKSLEINPQYANAYYNRGYAKDELKDYYGAISDYTKALEINPQYAEVYKNRSISKEMIGDIKGACVDAKKAVSFGDTATDNKNWIKDNC